METASIRSARVSALSHATEDKTKVVEAMTKVVAKSFSGDFHSARMKGHYGNEILLLKIVSSSPREAEVFLKQLWKRLLAYDREMILSATENSMDQSGTLFLRVDKGQALHGNVRIGSVDTIRVELQFSPDKDNKGEIVRTVQKTLSTISTP